MRWGELIHGALRAAAFLSVGTLGGFLLGLKYGAR